MPKRYRRACFAVVLALLTQQAALAKPPDPAADDPFVMAPPDTITPYVLLARQKCPYLQNQAAPRPAVPLEIDVNDALTNLSKLSKARRLYQAGERCRLRGNGELAAKYYEEAHLACPHCRFGMLAMERLSQFDSERAEAAGEPGMDFGEVIRLLGYYADVEFDGMTRFRVEVPVGALRIRVEYNAQHDGNAAVQVRVP
jgi:hypothetical protein